MIMKKIMSLVYGMAAITSLTLGAFTFKLSPFIGSLFVVMALAFVVIAFIAATQEQGD